MGAALPIIGRIYDSVGPTPSRSPVRCLWWSPQRWLVIVMTVIVKVGMALVMMPLMTVHTLAAHDPLLAWLGHHEHAYVASGILDIIAMMFAGPIPRQVTVVEETTSDD